MVPLHRGEAPPILQEKAPAWTADYLAQCSVSRPPRPDARRYGHPAVRNELRRMSHGKCFYCETKLADGEEDVDHYFEVHPHHTLAFAWENLYLACRGCNSHKTPDARAPNAACVDPCATAHRPADHLSFDDECIQPRDDRGRCTIAKYRLDRDALDLKRSRHLKEVMKRHRAMQTLAMAEGRSTLTARELEILRRYGDPSMPYAAMMADYLTALGL